MGAQDGWWRKCALWGQLNVQEHDPATIDVERWKDYWRRTHIDGVTINASGIIHYYPTDQPHAWVSPWLKGRDLFGELVAAARELDLYVLARFTPSRVHEEFALSHPDWLMTDANGQPRVDPGHDPGQSRRMYHTCMNGPHYRWWVPEVMFRELIERYDVDGFFFNAWQTPERTIQVLDTGASGLVTLGPCHCPYCRKGFRAATGYEVPKTADWSDPVWLAWLEWHNDCMDSLAEQYQKAAKALKATATSVLNIGGDLERMNDSGHWRVLGRLHDMIDHDHQSRHGPIWSIGMTGRLLRATIGVSAQTGRQSPAQTGWHLPAQTGWHLPTGTPYYHLFGVYGGQGRITAQPAAEHTLMISEMIASGSRLWYHIIGANTPDRRPFDAVERMFGFYHRNREHFVDAESAAQVAIVFSQRGADAYGRDDAARLCGDPYRGAAHVLVRGRVPFDLLAVEDLTTDRIDRYRALVLPNQAALSDAQCDAIRRYVARGGGLVATFETSRCTEVGARREEGFALGDVLGVRALADVAHGPYQNAYVRLEHHDVLGRGLEGTEAVPSGAGLWHCPVAPAADARVHLTFIPPIPHMPPERAYFHVPRTDTVLALSREHGAGRVVYFACDIDRWCAARPAGALGATNNPDHRAILLNAVRWVLREPLAVEVAGEGLVDAFVYRTPGRLIVHLVNCTNPDNWAPPAEAIVPIGEQTIALRIPERIAGARLLWADRDLGGDEIRVEGGATVIRVPRIEAYEVVVCGLA